MRLASPTPTHPPPHPTPAPTDVPAHRLMRYNAGRHLDTSARGLGATPAIPVTSCGEENLTMVKDR